MKLLTLLGAPKSTQHCYKYRWTGKFLHSYLDKKCVDLRASYKKQLREQYSGTPLKKNIAVYMTLFMPTKRKADIDNFHKLVLDAMSGIVYEDDNQIKELHTYMDYDKDNPRIDLEIVTLSTEEK